MPSSRNNQSPENHPLVAARDRLQSSARDLIRNIESAMGTTNNNTQPNNNPGPETSLEQAFRSLFSSCTTGATMNEENDDDDDEAAEVTPTSSRDRSGSSLESRSSPVVPVPQSRGRGSSAKGPLRRLSNKFSERVSPPPPRPTPSPILSDTPTHHTAGEHVYAQLYLEEETERRVAAAPAPSHSTNQNRRQRSPQQLLGISPMTPNPQPKKRVSTKPFPKSSPTQGTTPLRALSPTQGIAIPDSPTFDDGISAISSHTLEAMARNDPVRTQMVSNLPHRSWRASPPATPPRPVTPKHGGGHYLQHDPRSNTPSTRTTQSSRTSMDRSFEQWKHQDQEFWEAEVAVETTKIKKKKKPRGRRSSDSSWQQPRRHPHETLPFHPSDVFFRRSPDSDSAEI